MLVKLRIFKIAITTGFFLIQNIHEVTWWFKYWSCVFEYSWSDLMGILNIQKVPSWIILNFHEAKSWVFWIFMKWMFKSWRQVNIQKLTSGVNIHEMTSWVFWIFKSDVMDILNIHIQYSHDASFEYSHDGTLWVFKIFMNIQNTYGVSLWIFKLHMTSLHAYSKYPKWRQLLNI